MISTASLHQSPHGSAGSLLWRNIGRVGHSFLANHCSKVVKIGQHDNIVLLNNAKANIYGSSIYFSSQPGNHIMRPYAQVLQKRLCWICSRIGSSLPATMIACATCLVLTKSHPSTLGIFGFSTKDLPWRKAWAVTPSIYHPIHVPFESHRQARLAHLSASIFSVLKHLRLFIRAIYLTILFSPTIARVLLIDFSDVTSRKTCLHLLIGALEKAGPTFITWAHWASTRPDLFPRDLCDELSKLPNKAPVHSFSYTKEIIEKVFGRKLHEIFDDFEETPIASGSVFQVHRATLRSQYEGKQGKSTVVAVKVRHPGTKELFQLDFEIVECFAKLLRFTPKFKWLKLDKSLQEIAVFMKSEVDLVQKAYLLARFSVNSHKYRDASFPKPLFPIHPAVLVETCEEGDTLSHYVDKKIASSGKLRRALVHAGTRACLNMMMVDKFIFAGMQPQNVLVRIDEGKPHLIFLDVGVPAELSVTERNYLVQLFTAVGRRDGRTAAECTLKLSKKQSCPDPNMFVKDVKDSFNFWDSDEGGYIDPCECTLRLLEKVRHHEVNIDGNVCTAITSTLALENWQRKLYIRSNRRVLQTMHMFSPAPVGHGIWTERGKPIMNEYESKSHPDSFLGKWRDWVPKETQDFFHGFELYLKSFCRNLCQNMI